MFLFMGRYMERRSFMNDKKTRKNSKLRELHKEMHRFIHELNNDDAAMN